MLNSLHRIIEMKRSIEFKRIFRKNKLGKYSKASYTALKKKAGKDYPMCETNEPMLMRPDEEKKKCKTKRKLENGDSRKKNTKKRKQSTSTPSLTSTSVGRKRKIVMKNKSIESHNWTKMCKRKEKFNAAVQMCNRLY